MILLLAFAGMVAAIEGLHTALAWWRGELAEPGVLDVLLIGALPVFLWLWWRHLSPFGRGRGQCLAASCENDAKKN
ncbi:MAG: hypothetical protein N3C63_11995 [Rhodocyclaceae bacterium]|nr:hypothetical protein [Rhodocyclaceae bacterium]